MKRFRAILHLLLTLSLLTSVVFFLVPSRLTASSPSPNPEITADAPLFTRLLAAGYDAPTGELLVVGESDGLWPGVNRAYLHENLLLTLRAAYGNPIEWPGVTIEFEPQPQPGHLPVFYFGQSDNTHHGQITFEADRLLKSYSLGKDNLTEAPMSSNAPCYLSVLDKLVELQIQDYQSGDVDPQRFFFKPAVTLEITPDESAVNFADSKMVLDWAYIPPDTSKRTPNATAAAQHFVDCFNDNYDTFAAEQAALGHTTLYELKILGEVAALAKWIQQKNLDSVHEKLDGIHFPWLDAYADAAVNPATTTNGTPAITVSKTFTVGQTIITQSIYGGVDIEPDLTYQTEADADQLVNAAKNARPHTSSQEWPSPCSGGNFTFNENADQRVPTCGVHVHRMSKQTLLEPTLSNSGSAVWLEENSIAKMIENGSARLAGYNNALERLRQLLNLPANPEPDGRALAANDPLILLTFDWAIGPRDANMAAVDFLYVRLRGADGSLITTLHTITNLATPELIWQTMSIDLSSLLTPYLGQTVQLSFETQTNGSGVTTFYLDNIFLDSDLFLKSNPVLLTGVTINGPANGDANMAYTFTAVPSPATATAPVTYLWSPEPDNGQGTTGATYTWLINGEQTIMVTVQNCCSVVDDSHTILIEGSDLDEQVYLPLAIKGGGTLLTAHPSRANGEAQWSLPAPDFLLSPPDTGSALRYSQESWHE